MGRKRHAIAALAASALAGLLPALPARGDGPNLTSPEFAPVQLYAMPPTVDPTSAAVADVTGDGLNDVIVSVYAKTLHADPAEFMLYVLPGKPDGTLGAIVEHPSHNTALLDPQLGTGDLNGDTLADVVLGTDKGVDIYIQAGGTLLPPELLPTTSDVLQVEVGDLDQKGRRDILVSTRADVVFFQNQQNGFVPTTVTTEPQLEVEMADATDGAHLDVVAYTDDVVRVWEAHSERTLPDVYETSFEPVEEYPANAEEPSGAGLGVGDVTGDGLNDVLLSLAGIGTTPRMFVFPQIPLELQQGNRTLAAPMSQVSGTLPGPVEAEDIDDDYVAEVITAHPDFIGLYRAGASGALMSECTFPIPYTAHSAKGLALGDVTGDGLQDIVMAGDEEGVLVLPQQAAAEGVAASLTLSAAATQVAKGGGTELSGVLDLAGACPQGGQTIEIRRTGPGGAVQVLPAVSEPDGSFSLYDAPAAAGDYAYQATWAGDDRRAPASSQTATLKVVGPAPGTGVQGPQKATGLVLSASKAAVGYGKGVSLTATLTGFSGAPGAPLQIFGTPPGGPRTAVATGILGEGGTFETGLAPDRTTAYEAEFAGDAAHLASKSAAVVVAVRAVATGKVLGGAKGFGKGDAVRYAAAVAPAHPKARVVVQRRRGGDWDTVRSTLVGLGADGRATVSLPNGKGRFRVRTVFGGDADHLEDRSGWIGYRVLV